MKISVIIPTYKPQGYLWECLDSMAAQTLSKDEYEVIIVLNGCCSPWKDAIEDYIKTKMKGFYIKFIQTDMPGVSNARNIALDKVEGKYVTFIDDDDYVSPVFLERLLSKMKGDVNVVLSNAVAFNDNDPSTPIPYSLSKIYNKYSAKHRVKLTSGASKFFSGPCMKLIPMEVIQDKRFDVRFKNGEDSLFMLLISDRVASVTFADNDAIYYRRYRDASAITQKGNIVSRMANSFRLIKEYILIYVKYDIDFVFFATRILGTLKAVFVTH